MSQEGQLLDKKSLRAVSGKKADWGVAHRTLMLRTAFRRLCSKGWGAKWLRTNQSGEK
jgi:hypothetical protein